MAVAIFTFLDSDLLEEADGIVGSLVFIRRMFFRQGRKGKTDVIFQCKQRRRGNGRKEKSKAACNSAAMQSGFKPPPRDEK